MSENAKSVVITGLGMTTPVGRTAYETCASIRADISRVTDVDYFEYENPQSDTFLLKGALIAGEMESCWGLGKIARMVSSSIKDLLDTSGLSTADLSNAGFYCGLPDANRADLKERVEELPYMALSSTANQRVEELLCTRVEQWSGISFRKSQKMFPEGHVSCIKAIVSAVSDLREEDVQYAVVGGVDTLVERSTLVSLFKDGRVITEDNPDGFFPGEAAAYFMLETLEHAQERGAHIFATLESPAVAVEPETVFSDVPSTTQGLRTAIRTTLEGLGDEGENTGLMICDLNGETYRAKEFGTVIPAVFSDFKESWKVVHPAELMGDIGAASFAASVCIAARALEHGYAGTDHVLVWGGSDNGLRGSVYLRKFS